MRLVFLDSAVLHRWALHLVAGRTRRRIQRHSQGIVQQISNAIEVYDRSGIKPACTVASASDVITKFFKDSSLPFEGDLRGFQTRKLVAREAAALVRERTELLFPTRDHFLAAEGLWLSWCTDQAKESYAQFSDYLDSALILNPPKGTAITDALLAHEHVKYILHKERSNVQPYALRVRL